MNTLTAVAVFTVSLYATAPAAAAPFNDRGQDPSSQVSPWQVEPDRYDTLLYNKLYPKRPAQIQPPPSSFNNKNGSALETVSPPPPRRLRGRDSRCEITVEQAFNDQSNLQRVCYTKQRGSNRYYRQR